MRTPRDYSVTSLVIRHSGFALVSDYQTGYWRYPRLPGGYLTTSPRRRIQTRAKPRTSSSDESTCTGTSKVNQSCPAVLILVPYYYYGSIHHQAVCAHTRHTTHKPSIAAKRLCSLSSHLSFLQASLLNCTKATNTKKRNHASLGDYATMLHSSGDSPIGSTIPQLPNTTLIQTAQIR